MCTGSLVLGAAGLLQGYNAATHWSATQYLSAFGATPTKTRVCVDRNRITGGGVTAGIDFALTLVSILTDRKNRGSHPARPRIDPAPPSQRRLAPDTAPPEVLAFVKERMAARGARRIDAITAGRKVRLNQTA